MKLFFFLLISMLHVTLCALTDAWFNRLIFRELSLLPVRSREKKAIYDLPEWKFITLFFLIGISVVVPVLFALLLGGWRYVLLYGVIFLLIQWDVIFGHVLMGDWLGDIPAMKLPGIGWLRIPLPLVIALRLVGAIALLIWAIRLP